MNDITKIRELQKDLYTLNKNYSRLEDLYATSQERNTRLLEQVQSLLEENRTLREQLELKQSSHNERGAGRKKGDAKWIESYMTFCRLYQAALSMDELMNHMQISRATYYRYKKVYDKRGIMATEE